MEGHLLTAYQRDSMTHLWCERDDTGRITKITAPSGLELKFSYFGEWVIFQDQMWTFNKEEGLKPARQYFKGE